MKENEINEQCKKLIGVEFPGNTVPLSWYRYIKTQNGTVNHVAITLLADIVFWYRPVEERNPETGEAIGYRQKFKADKLQKNYQSYVDLFGFTKIQVKRAFDDLIRLKLVKREFKTIETNEGLKLSNVMFIEPIVENVLKITYDQRKSKRNPSLPQNNHLSTSKSLPPNSEVNTSLLQSNHPPTSKLPPPSPEVRTNTKNTTEITTKNTTEIKSSLNTSFSNNKKNNINNNLYSSKDSNKRSEFISATKNPNSFSNENPNPPTPKNNSPSYKPPNNLLPENIKKQRILFEKFWLKYPRKINKVGALAEWLKINPNEALFNEIMEGLDNYLKYEWPNMELEYIIYPSTFLAQRRWEDKPGVQYPKPEKVWATSEEGEDGLYDSHIKPFVSGVLKDI